MLVHALVSEQECSDVIGDVVWLARRALGSMRLGDAELLGDACGGTGRLASCTTAEATRPPTRRRSSSAADALLIGRVRLVGAGEALRTSRVASDRRRAEPEAFRTSLQAFVLNQLADVLH
jgi:hypothetical protein